MDHIVWLHSRLHSFLSYAAGDSWEMVFPVHSVRSSNQRLEGLPLFLKPDVIPSVMVFAGIELLLR